LCSSGPVVRVHGRILTVERDRETVLAELPPGNHVQGTVTGPLEDLAFEGGHVR
jgi:hypothetical protein